MRDLDLYIDGRWHPGDGTFEVRSPYDGTLLGTAADAKGGQVTQAVAAAVRALHSGLPAERRAAILRAVSADIAERSEEFARGICAEAGKPISAARQEVGRAVTTLRLSAEEALRIGGETMDLATGAGAAPFAFTLTRPAGVVAAITPFNFPLNLVAHKIGPALAAGCPVVLKPSERTPLTAGLLTEAFARAGLPAGWLNLVTGDPRMIAGVLTAADDVAVITFTGSADIGWALKQASPRKKHVLELGSNTALAVADDADVDAAVAAVATGGYAFGGQACISVQRVYVQAGVFDTFVATLVDAVGALPGGDPRQPETVVGPLISTDAQDRVLAWIDEALDGGAHLAVGGSVRSGVLEPTVVVNPAPDARLVTHEVFGPVVSVVEVPTVADAVAAINRSRYGLNTAIFTRDLAAAMRFARTVSTGTAMINVTPSFRADNMPYGGVKDSGQGREGVRYAVEALTEATLVIMAEPADPDEPAGVADPGSGVVST